MRPLDHHTAGPLTSSLPLLLLLLLLLYIYSEFYRKLCFVFTEEVRRLEAELGKQERLYQNLSDEHQQSLTELKKLREVQSETNIKSTRQIDKIKELQRELAAKEDLVKKIYPHSKIIYIPSFQVNYIIILYSTISHECFNMPQCTSCTILTAI